MTFSCHSELDSESKTLSIPDQVRNDREGGVRNDREGGVRNDREGGVRNDKGGGSPE